MSRKKTPTVTVRAVKAALTRAGRTVATTRATMIRGWRSWNSGDRVEEEAGAVRLYDQYLDYPPRPARPKAVAALRAAGYAVAEDGTVTAAQETER